MKCYYHGSDLDGKCSAAILYYSYGHNNIEFIPSNYGNIFDFSTLNENEEVWVLDFSFSEEKFEELYSITKNITWIDHHISSIKKFENTKFAELSGIRKNGTAGCELTWQYIYDLKEMPLFIKMLGKYDVWDWSIPNLEELQCGMRLYETNPESEIWKELFNEYEILNDMKDSNIILEEVIELGETILKYRNKEWESIAKRLSFITIFEGYKCIACNVSGVNSKFFDSVDNGTFDIRMPFYWNGTQWIISLYTTKDNIDVSEIARKYGGGGHKQAAGFERIDWFPKFNYYWEEENEI